MIGNLSRVMGKLDLGDFAVCVALVTLPSRYGNTCLCKSTDKNVLLSLNSTFLARPVPLFLMKMISDFS